jgi:hypothetical protein
VQTADIRRHLFEVQVSIFRLITLFMLDAHFLGVLHLPIRLKSRNHETFNDTYILLATHERPMTDHPRSLSFRYSSGTFSPDLILPAGNVESLLFSCCQLRRGSGSCARRMQQITMVPGHGPLCCRRTSFMKSRDSAYTCCEAEASSSHSHSDLFFSACGVE